MSGRYPGEGIGYLLQYSWASLVAQLVKNPSAVWETWVRSLGWENSLGKGKATPLQYSGLENSMTVQSMGSQRVGHDWVTFTFTSLSQVPLVVENLPDNAGDMRHGFDFQVGKIPGAGNVNPLQYSCLVNSIDRGTWQATVHRVTKSHTWLSN